jgi:hypothetical protein
LAILTVLVLARIAWVLVVRPQRADLEPETGAAH